MKTIIKVAALACILSSCTSTTEKTTPKNNTNNPAKSISERPLLAQNTMEASAPVDVVYYVNASSGLSLREGTNLRSKKKLTLPYGAQIKHVGSPEHTTMTIDGITGDMIEVDYQGAKGFVFNGYLSRLAPPHEDESVTSYTKRISTEKTTIEVKKVANPKGATHGLTTSFILPAKTWTEAYGITKSLFDLPSSLKLDLNTPKAAEVIQNKDKRSKTLIDEIAVQRNDKGNIQTIQYTYQLKTYSRKVSIARAEGGFMIKEIEVSK